MQTQHQKPKGILQSSPGVGWTLISSLAGMCQGLVLMSFVTSDQSWV